MNRESLSGRVRDLVCVVSFILLTITYWITAPETVSYWDCPEYVAAAYQLEVGHPPGNPLWMLTERVVSMLAPTPQAAAYVINLSSGVFTALAGALLAASVFPVTVWVLRRRRINNIRVTTAAAGVSLISALTFGWCDSAWYSAVEAEVYAMSICFTALTVWIMVKWAFMHNRLRSNRYLVLLAYIFGLSLGVHQLNLLVIPALALVWGLRRGIRNAWKLLLIVVLGMVAVGCVLTGMMPGSIALAADFELLAVNTLGLPMLSGVVIYILVLGASLLLALLVTARSNNRGAVAAAIFPAIFMSCIFAVKAQFMVSAAVSAIVSVLLVQAAYFDGRRLNLAFWMLSMLMTGYGCYALIPIRGDIPSPANPALPGEPFGFAAYQAREQYGSSPLLYGRTPYSRPLMVEEMDPGDSIPVYRRYALKHVHRIVAPYRPGERVASAAGTLNPEDSLHNAQLMKSGRPGYVVKRYLNHNIMTPELDMWLPRLTSGDPADIDAYADWAGMDTSNMIRVAISEAIDSTGRPVARMNRSGQRDTVYSYRPTMLQNLQYLGTYQIGFMYFRYLMWNFCGRQNDRPSQGAVQSGNFITGIPVIDNAMLGAEDSLPPEAGSDNPGRNVYYGIPLILGILGLIWLLRNGKRGRAAATVTFLLFFMTGLAIVIYLNQSPGEPRERDYSFLGSFWIFSAWVGFGALWLVQFTRRQWTFLLMLGVPVWMCVENFDDHDRSGRHAASSIATSILESLEPDAILFVDGDNFTFPLWYAQEVEGVRRDVKVINTSYLSMSRYAAGQLEAWREAPAIKTVLSRADVIHGAFDIVNLPAGLRDTLDASELLHRLRQWQGEGRPTFAARYARLPVAGGDTIVYDLRNLTRSGKGTAVYGGQLLMFDIAANATATGRPIYWDNHLAPQKRLRADESWTTPGLFAIRMGVLDESDALDWLSHGVRQARIPNRLSPQAYLDVTPAMMTGVYRSSLVLAARRQLEAGRLRDARQTLVKADVIPGDAYKSYAHVNDGDSVLDIRMELARLQRALADSLAPVARTPLERAEVIELRARARYNSRKATERAEQWRRYGEALPPRLRHALGPIY